jgi:hypothetical protein
LRSIGRECGTSTVPQQAFEEGAMSSCDRDARVQVVHRGERIAPR